MDTRSSDIVNSQFSVTLTNGHTADACELINGAILLVSESGVACFRTRESINDPLASGLIDHLETTVTALDGHFIQQVASGCIDLVDGRVLLLLPNQISLFPSKQDALYSRNLVGTLAYAIAD